MAAERGTSGSENKNIHAPVRQSRSSSRRICWPIPAPRRSPGRAAARAGPGRDAALRGPRSRPTRTWSPTRPTIPATSASSVLPGRREPAGASREISAARRSIVPVYPLSGAICDRLRDQQGVDHRRMVDRELDPRVDPGGDLLRPLLPRLQAAATRRFEFTRAGSRTASSQLAPSAPLADRAPYFGTLTDHMRPNFALTGLAGATGAGDAGPDPAPAGEREAGLGEGEEAGGELASGSGTRRSGSCARCPRKPKRRKSLTSKWAKCGQGPSSGGRSATRRVRSRPVSRRRRNGRTTTVGGAAAKAWKITARRPPTRPLKASILGVDGERRLVRDVDLRFEVAAADQGVATGGEGRFARSRCGACAPGRLAGPGCRARPGPGRLEFDPLHPRHQRPVGGLQPTGEADRDRRRFVAGQRQRARGRRRG